MTGEKDLASIFILAKDAGGQEQLWGKRWSC